MKEKNIIFLRLKRLFLGVVCAALIMNLCDIAVMAKCYEKDGSNIGQLQSQFIEPNDSISWAVYNSGPTLYIKENGTVLDTVYPSDPASASDGYVFKKYYYVSAVSANNDSCVLNVVPISIRVYYTPNGGVGLIDPSINTDGGNVIITDQSPTREGFTHIGWSNNPNATTSTYNAGDELTPKQIAGMVGTISQNMSVTLYAVWQKNPEPEPSPAPDNPKQTPDEKFTEDDITYDIVDSQAKEVVYKAPENKKAKNLKVPDQVVHNGITYTVTEIAPNAFKGCKNATNINIPNSVKKIGSNAASGLPKLRSVTIGTGTEVIDKKAFNKCPNLTVINIKSKKLKKVGPGALKNTKVGIKIKVPKKTSIKKLLQYKKIFKNSGAKMLKIYK